MTKSQDKERILKAAREKQEVQWILVMIKELCWNLICPISITVSRAHYHLENIDVKTSIPEASEKYRLGLKHLKELYLQKIGIILSIYLAVSQKCHLQCFTWLRLLSLGKSYPKIFIENNPQQLFKIPLPELVIPVVTNTKLEALKK